MADNELVNVAAVIGGGLIGSLLITLFPYFNGKRAIEEQQAEIRAKEPGTRTPEEQYLLDTPYPSFWEEYKYRFFFGLLSGVGLVLAYLNSGLMGIGNLTTGQALFAGITASGFLSALSDKIRDTGTKAVANVKAVARNQPVREAATSG